VRVDETEAIPSRRVAWTVGTKAAIFVLGGVSSVVVSRALEPSGRGAYAVLLSISAMALSLGHLSLEQAHVFFWQYQESRDSLITNGIVLGFTIGTAVAGGAAILVHLLGPAVLPLASFRLLLVALVAVPFSMVVLYVNGFFILRDHIERINRATLATAVFSTAAIVILALSGHLTLRAAIVVTTVSAVVPLFFLLPHLRFKLRSFSKALVGKTVGLGLRYHIGMASLFLLFRVDIVLLDSRVSQTRVGLYSLAVVLAELTYLLTDSIAQIVLPRQLAVSLSEGGQYTARVVRINVVAATLTLAAIVASSPLVVPLVFGEAFAGSVSPLVALAPGVLALAIIRPVGGFLVRLNRPLMISLLTSSALIVNVVLNLLFIPVWGIVGAALASSVAYSGLAVAYVVWLVREGKLHYVDLLPRWHDVRDPILSLFKKG
jgi:O-antigen/teichoic acid export membrane protein